MTARHQSWPRAWLMTDERMGDRLWEAIGRLPESAGIVFRHYSLGRAQRAHLAERVAGICKERGITLAVAGDAELARHVEAALLHNPPMAGGPLPFSRSVHSFEEAEAAKLAQPALVFVSPVYATRSHPRMGPLGPELAIAIAKAAGVPAIALGGMTEQKFEKLQREGFFGWAGIDAWTRP